MTRVIKQLGVVLKLDKSGLDILLIKYTASVLL